MVFHYLHALDGVGLQVVGQLVVPPVGQVHSFHVEFADVFPVVRDFPVVVHIHAWQFLQHVFDRLVFRADELRHVVVDRVLPPVDASRTYLDLFQCENFRFEADTERCPGGDLLPDRFIS